MWYSVEEQLGTNISSRLQSEYTNQPSRTKGHSVTEQFSPPHLLTQLIKHVSSSINISSHHMSDDAFDPQFATLWIKHQRVRDHLFPHLLIHNKQLRLLGS